MIQRDKRYFSDGLNADDYLTQLKAGQYINAQNIRIGSSDKGKFDRIESVGGTDALFTNLPSGTNYCIGACADEVNDRIIFFVYNSSSPTPYHRIYAYEKSTGSCKVVLAQENFASGQTGLAFSTSKLINGAFVIGGIVYFIDCDGVQKRVNIDRYIAANELVSPLGPPTDYTDDMFTLIRRPPMFPPTTITKGTDGAYSNNFIKDESFQFALRYRFKDGEESVLSPWSLLIPSNLPSETYNYITVNTFYAVGTQTDTLTEDIKEVDLIVRYGNNGKSFAVKTFSVTTATVTLTYDFYNDQYGIPLDDATAAKAQDNIPLTSEAIELAKNRIFLANNTSGYDTPTSTSLSATISTINNPTTGQRVLKSNSKRQIGIVFYDRYGRQSGVVTNDNLIFVVGANTYDPTGSGTNTIPFKKSIDWTLVNNSPVVTEIPLWATHYEIVWTKDKVHETFVQGQSAGVFYMEKNVDTGLYENASRQYDNKKKAIRIDISFLVKVNMGYTFTEGDTIRLYWNKKSGSTYTQTYKDFNLIGSDGNNVFINAESLDTGLDNGDTSSSVFFFEIWTPALSQTNDVFYGTGNVYRINDYGTINREYSVTSGSLLGDVWIQQREYNKTLAPIYAYGRGNRTTGYTGEPMRLYAAGFGTVNFRIPFNVIDIDNGTPTGYMKVLPQLAATYYIKFQKPGTGDIDTSCQIKFPYELITLRPMPSYSAVFEIRKYNFGGGSYTTIGSKTINENDPMSGEVTIVTQKQKLENGKYYEFWCTLTAGGDGYNIIEIKFFVGKDGTIKFTNPEDEALYDSYTVKWYQETMNQSERNWSVWERDLGRPNIVTKLGQVTRETQIVFSNTYVQGSQVNGLSSFDVLDQDTLDPVCGGVQRLIYTSKINQLGNVLVAICEKETASIYLGETQMVSNQGNQFLAQSTSTIGTINILKGSRGTSNPESACEYMGNIFWYNSANGCWTQYSVNGLDDFSAYNFRRPANLFSLQYRSLSQSQITALGSRPFVVGGINPFHKEVMFTIPTVLAQAPKGNLPTYSPVITYPYDIYDGQGKTLVFDFINNKWVGSQSFQAEYFVWMANELYSFKNGGLYKHNSDTKNTFYGVASAPKLMFVANQTPMMVKSFEDIRVDADDTPAFVNVYTEYPNVQTSDLVDTDFADKEGVLYSNLFRDRLSPNASGNYDLKMLKGDKIRGQYMMCMLEFDDASDVNLNYVTIGYIPSKGQTI